jgi:hypothetical protein
MAVTVDETILLRRTSESELASATMHFSPSYPSGGGLGPGKGRGGARRGLRHDGRADKEKGRKKGGFAELWKKPSRGERAFTGYLAGALGRQMGQLRRHAGCGGR